MRVLGRPRTRRGGRLQVGARSQRRGPATAASRRRRRSVPARTRRLRDRRNQSQSSVASRSLRSCRVSSRWTLRPVRSSKRVRRTVRVVFFLPLFPFKTENLPSAGFIDRGTATRVSSFSPYLLEKWAGASRCGRRPWVFRPETRPTSRPSTASPRQSTPRRARFLRRPRRPKTSLRPRPRPT